MRLPTLVRMMAISCLVIPLMGCKQPSAYLNLMQHPEQLQQQFVQCQTNEAPGCAVVQRAAQDYLDFNNQRLNNPEMFGDAIIQAQEMLAKTKKELQSAQQKQTTSPNDTEAKKKVTTLSETYTSQLEKINAMLAVVSVTSPE